MLAFFFNYLAENQLLPNAGRLAKSVAALGPKIVANANDPLNWGPAKTLVMAALEEGVDLKNERAFQHFITRYNQRLMARTVAVPPPWAPPADELLPDLPPALEPPQPAHRSEPKTGRNDPCPCGSGEKFKKCCGA